MKKNSKIKIVLSIISALMIVACGETENKNDKLDQNAQFDRYVADIEFISRIPRTPGSDHHSEIKDMCATRFKDLGFQVELHDYGSGVNVIGIKTGILNPSERILVSAHYDSISGCNGADDNASGIAGVFETARILVSEEFDRSLIVACWDEEETGLLGSEEYVVREKNAGSDIKISYIYEMIGYKSDEPNSQQLPSNIGLLYPQQVANIIDNRNRGDFILFVYDDLASNILSNITEHANTQNLPLIQIEVSSDMKNSIFLAYLRRSDHASFWDEDYPSVMITDTAEYRNPYYHCIGGEDNIDTLEIDFALKVINTTSESIRDALMNSE